MFSWLLQQRKLLGLMLILIDISAMAGNDTTDGVTLVLDRVHSHSFHPVDEKAFTIDRELRVHGIADLNDQDWKVRLLALRDLVKAGDDGIPSIADGLRHHDVQVRYLCASALGILKAVSAVSALEKVVREDKDALARSQAVVALGQIESTSSLDLLSEVLENDPSRDVRHQCELAIDQIKKNMGSTDALRSAYRSLDPSNFELLKVGAPAPEFKLPDTEGRTWRLGENKKWVILIWVFADWCPVCHGEFQELIDMREEFEKSGYEVVTLEAHGMYRSRVMVGKELEPDYWFSKQSFKETYTQKIWWPHLLDRGGVAGATYGVDPMAFSVHAEYINRPATVIVDPDGIVQFAYYGTFWGDRPSIEETYEMIKTNSFNFQHPKRLKMLSHTKHTHAVKQE